MWGQERNQPSVPSENTGFIESETGKGYFFPCAEIPPDHSWEEDWGTCLQ